MEPFLGYDPFSLPHTGVKKQLAEFHEILDLHIESPAAFCDAAGTFFPINLGDSHRSKYALRENVEHVSACQLLNGRGEHIGVHAVV